MIVLPVSAYPSTGMVRLVKLFPDPVAVSPEMAFWFPDSMTSIMAESWEVRVGPTRLFLSPDYLT
jgi:hypothetical protein